MFWTPLIRAGTGSTAEINEFADYVAIDAHAMTCDVLTDEDLLEIVQFRTDYTNETEKEQVELDSVPLQPTKMNLDAAKKTVHVSLLHKDLVTNEMFCSKFFFVKKHLI
jgi:hypothetical protein